MMAAEPIWNSYSVDEHNVSGNRLHTTFTNTWEEAKRQLSRKHGHSTFRTVLTLSYNHKTEHYIETICTVDTDQPLPDLFR